MKLSQIYSTNHRIFPPIVFNGVDDCEPSVIFAKVKKPKDTHKDSHNLGKTLLVDLIDFLLLKDISKVPSHFLAKHGVLFADWAFYLELQNRAGQYITIRREVNDPTRIAFRTAVQRSISREMRSLASGTWDHTDIPLERAVQLLDAYLELDAIKPFAYRSGVGYFLRTQGDYRQLFQLEKTSAAPDKTWKPYLAKLFGIDSDLVARKYALDDEVAALKNRVDELQQSLPQTQTKQLNELRMEINTRQQVLLETGGRIDRFQFAREELRLSKELAEGLETEAAELNERLSNLDYDIIQMQASVQRDIMFNVQDIRSVFEEASIHFSAQLEKEYEELIRFNRTITTERKKFLSKQVKELERERGSLIRTKETLDKRREQCYAILQSHDTFRKFKLLQKEQATQRAEIEQKILQVGRLEELLMAEQRHRSKRQEREGLIQEIVAAVAAGTEIQAEINKEFARMVRRVLSLNGSVFLRTNQAGNIEPEHTADPANVNVGQSSQSEGTTYKRILCILFDMAVLKAYSGRGFFRFVYHDGILETMDDRKKIEMIELLSEFAAETGVQSIFSVIESELPRDQDGERTELPQGHVVRELSDEGNRGRLFRMNSF